MPTMLLKDEVAAAHERGWRFTPLAGKIPKLPGWASAPPATLDETLAWLPCNIGLRTGSVSGVVVIDDDTGEYPLPHTVAVLTGGYAPSGHRKRQFYYACPTPPPRNSVSRIAPGVDVRSDGGQVVFPGSTHPETNQHYEWLHHPDDTPLAPYPAALVAGLTEINAAPEGRRNDTLNRVAFRLRSDPSLAPALEHAALQIGLSETETKATIQSALSVPLPSRPEYVLIPGAQLDDQGTLHEIGCDDFAATVLSRLPKDAAYVRGDVIGRLPPSGQHTFQPLTPNAMRSLVDAHMRLGKWVKVSSGGAGSSGGSSGAPPTRTIAFTPCSKDLASLCLETPDPPLRRIELLTSRPVFVPASAAAPCAPPHLLPPGWSPPHHYYAGPPVTPVRDRDAIAEHLLDLVVDFPFQSDADRCNLIGLLLTPLIRPLCHNAPLHLVTAPSPGAGKTLLVSALLSPLADMQLPPNEEECDKRIISLLLSGQTVIHLDNLATKLASPALASLLTSQVYAGRILGRSEVVQLPNHTTVVATANNPTLSPELARRTVPIRLSPPTARLSGYTHPDIRRHAASVRHHTHACLAGMVLNWIDDGQPPHSNTLGSFEDWSAIVGGCLCQHGFTAWRTQDTHWRDEVDPESDDLRRFVAAWWDAYGDRVVSAAELVRAAEAADVFHSDARTPRGATTALAQKLSRHRGAVVASASASGPSLTIRHVVGQRRRGWRLVEE